MIFISSSTMQNNRGNILITVLMVLMILSATTLYIARESFWALRVSLTEKDHVELDLQIPSALKKVERLIDGLPMDPNAQPPEYCHSSCVVIPTEANHYFATDLAHIPAAFAFSISHINGYTLIEYLGDDYFRSSIFLTSQNQAQLHMQATWKKSTLKSNILSLR